MAQELEFYLAVLKASYDYEPQSEDEIAIKEDQLLLLKERVDEDWWKVKIKGDSQEEDSPVGLVPAAYVEPVDHTAVVKALYDYEAAVPGELSVKEDEILLVFDTEQEWLLVQSKEGGKAGYVPGNYVEAITEDEAPQPLRIVVPPSAPRPVSTYVDPADRVASVKVTADDIKTWSVSEIDKKGKKKKGTLGIGNGALFFASESDKTPVQKWQINDVTDVCSEKSKHVRIDMGGAAAISLHFHAGSKDNVDAITDKVAASKALAAPSDSPGPSGSAATRTSFPDATPHKEMKKPSVHFSPASPIIIPAREEEEDEEESQPNSPTIDSQGPDDEEGEPGTALYDFTADGDDELSIVGGERLIILERDGDEWWKCRNSKGAEGVVPASYIELSDSTSQYTQASSRLTAVPDSNEGEEAAANEAAQRAEAERIEREKEQERAEKAQQKLEAQRRAKEAATAAEAERKKRKEAAAARVSPSPIPHALPQPAETKKAVENGTPNTTRPSSEINRTYKQLISSFCRANPVDQTGPPPERTRMWHDRSGQFRVEAAFLGFSNGKLRLHKVNGVIVEVPAEKMSLEDMRYVERLKGKKSRQQPTQRISEDDIPLALSRPGGGSATGSAQSIPPKKVSKIDWFDFFLSAGCDLDDCTRYAASFERDKIDETILPDITDATMRSLGLREGDIIRVSKAIEKRKPNDNLQKPSAHIQEQVLQDEELARQLQARESAGSSRSPAPNLFAGPGGVLKNPRRGRPQPSKSLPPSNVDINAIATVSDQIRRTTSPQSSTLSTAYPLLTSVQLPPRSSSAVPASSGFDDDAWTNRPSSAQPLMTTTTILTPHAPSAPAPAAPSPPAQSPPAASTLQPTHTSAASPAQPPASLAKTTESDIFDQLARLSELRKNSTTSGPPQSTSPSLGVPPISYRAGLTMGSSPAPIAQHPQNQPLNPQFNTQLNPQLAVSQQPSQPYNGPRGPFAPVPANRGLLQPLIPTQTGFNSFVPTRPGNNVSHFQTSPSQPPFLTQQPTGIPSVQPLMSQPTGLPFGGMSSAPYQNGGTFSPLQSQLTGMNPNFAQSPFNNSISPPPPVPPLPSSISNNNTSPANIFAQMKSGTFATDNDNTTPQPSVKYDALRTAPLATQATGWGQPYHAMFMGYQQ